MRVDAVDACGRRYLEVPVFPDGALKDAFRDASPDDCIECGAPIRHAVDRYFQRNDATDGRGAGLEADLLALTFDAVCGACGDRCLKGTP